MRRGFLRRVLVAAAVIAVAVVAIDALRRLERRRAVERVDLPVIGEAGDLPGDDAIRLSLSDDGNPVVDGSVCDWTDVVQRLGAEVADRSGADSHTRRLLRRVGLVQDPPFAFG